MAKGSKRLTALLLVLALSLSLLPAASLATSADSETGDTAETISQDSEVEEQTDADGAEVATFAVSGDVTTSSYDPYASVLYSYSDEVGSGIIRYVSQNPKGNHYQESYWGSKAGDSKNFCKSADVSMMLSYLEIDLLPKDIIAKCSDNTCMNRDWSNALHESGSFNAEKDKWSGLTFAKAMDNYLNGGGLYSPPMIRLDNDCYSTGQHYVIVISKMSSNSYEVLDPYNRDFYADNGIWTLEASDSKITKFYRKSKTYSCNFTDIYQYHLEQKTKLKNASKPKTMTEGDIFVPKGLLYGSETITKVTAGCYDMDGNAQSNCYATAKPNSVGYDLANMNNKLKFSQLSPGIYKYVVTATTDSGTKTYLSRIFTVLAKDQTVEEASLYLDSGCNIKLCAVPSGNSNKNNVDVCLTPNTESNYMRFKADYVGDGYYTLQVVGSGKYLTVYKSQNESGIRVIQNTMVNRDGQYWQILPTGNDYYYLVPKCAPTTCLTLGEEAAAGTELQTRTAGQEQDQTWLLRYVRPLISSLKNTSSGVQVKWGSVPNTTGYRIYRKKAGEDSWTRVKTIASGKTTSWTDTKTSNGVQYTYTIRSVYDGKLSPAAPKPSTYRVTAPTIQTPKNTGKGQVTVSWKLNTKGTGYQICYATNKSFEKSKTVTVKGGRSPSKVLKGLSKGKTYYIKVRAYKTVDDQRYYSAWSSQKSIKVTK